MAVNQESSKSKREIFKFRWVLPVFYKARKTLTEIVEQEKPVWLTPLVILSILVILSTLVSAPIRRNAIQMGSELPPDFQYYSPEQQEQFYAAQATQTSPLFLYVFPMLGGLLGVWLPWFLLSSMLYLGLTLAGSRAKSLRSFNLTAWTYLPIGLRLIVQTIAMLINKKVISAPGLSGFVSSDATGFTAYLGAILGILDVYFLWHVVLLFIGVLPLSGLTKYKAWIATGVTLLILVLLLALPRFLSSVMGGLSPTRSFFFF